MDPCPTLIIVMIILNDASYHAFEKYLIDDSHHGIA